MNFKNCLLDAVTALLLVMGSVFLNSLFTFFIIFIRKYHDWSNLSRGDNMAGTVTDFETHQGRLISITERWDEFRFLISDPGPLGHTNC